MEAPSDLMGAVSREEEIKDSSRTTWYLALSYPLPLLIQHSLWPTTSATTSSLQIRPRTSALALALSNASPKQEHALGIPILGRDIAATMLMFAGA